MSTLSADVHYYVWYRVLGNHAEAQRIIAALQNDVAARTAIRGRVLIRRDDPTTWMEIYEHVRAPGTFEPTLAAAAERHGAVGIAHDRARHVEAFIAPR